MTASNFDVADVTVTPDVVIACHDDVSQVVVWMLLKMALVGRQSHPTLASIPRDVLDILIG